MARKKRAEEKRVLMGDRCYQGAQWPDRLAPGQEYDLPAEFADWLVEGDFAMPVEMHQGADEDENAEPDEAEVKDAEPDEGE
jgi:hypothetical protein